VRLIALCVLRHPPVARNNLANLGFALTEYRLIASRYRVVSQS
jgi:hypothetical protein